MGPPPIELDNTLKELHDLDGGNADSIALLYTKPAGSLGPPSCEFPSAQKYARQFPTGLDISPEVRNTARNCESQLMGLVAGAMDLGLFDIQQPNLKGPSTLRADTDRTYGQIAKCQQSNLTWVECKEDVAGIGKRLAVFFPMDFLDGPRFSTLIDQEVLLDLMSKRTLALCGLPTPETTVIDSIPHTDTQCPKEDWRSKGVSHLIAAVEARPLPFVLKLPHSGAGCAVFIIRNDLARLKCINILRKHLPKYMPTSLLFQDPIPGKSFAISIFVTERGRTIFIGCSEEVHSEHTTGKSWKGGVMDYPSQDDQRKRYERLIEQVGGYVFSRGYIGPLGFDVMTDDQGNDFVIDINPRPPGSFLLGLLKGHLWRRSGLPYASLLSSVFFPGDRDSFESKVWDDICASKIIITSWCHGEPSTSGRCTYSAASLVVAESSRELLTDAVARVKALSFTPGMGRQ